MKSIKDKILSRGYWQVIIRPAIYLEKRIPDISELYPIIQKKSVRIRGWDFPHLDIQNPHKIDIDWVGEDLDWEHHISSWRFYQSGLFTHLSNLAIDWRDQSSIWPADEHWKPNTLLGAGKVIHHFTETMEFAARLALSDAGGESMYVEVISGNLEGRTLYMDDNRKWGFFQNYTASINEIPFIKECSRAELIADSKNIAVGASIELFKRFGWNVDWEQINSWQEELLKRR